MTPLNPSLTRKEARDLWARATELELREARLEGEGLLPSGSTMPPHRSTLDDESLPVEAVLEVADEVGLTLQDRLGDDAFKPKLRTYRDLGSGEGGSVTLSGVSAGFVGLGGGVAGLELGGAAAGVVGLASASGAAPGPVGLLALAVMTGPTLAGAAVGVGAGFWGFRRFQRWGFEKGQTALERVTRAIALEAEATPIPRWP